jgi:transcriptional regulator with XRE-family HTH domain
MERVHVTGSPRRFYWTKEHCSVYNLGCTSDRELVLHERGLDVMNEDFGELFRQERKRSGKRLGDVAGALGVAVTYLSDVERGTRPPLNADRIKVATAFMGTSTDTYSQLLRAAARQQGSFALVVPDTEEGQAAAAALQRIWPGANDELFRELLNLARKKEG